MTNREKTCFSLPYQGCWSQPGCVCVCVRFVVEGVHRRKGSGEILMIGMQVLSSEYICFWHFVFERVSVHIQEAKLRCFD